LPNGWESETDDITGAFHADAPCLSQALCSLAFSCSRFFIFFRELFPEAMSVVDGREGKRKKA
jgi:hypothetical protein